MACRDKGREIPRSRTTKASLETRPAEACQFRGGLPGFFGSVSRRSGESRNTRDWLAVLGGCGGRGSAVEFPDHRENTGNFIEIEPMVHARGERPQWICDEIPY